MEGFFLFHAKGAKEARRTQIKRKDNIMDENQISYRIIGAALDIHKSIGPGLLINFNSSKLSEGIHRVVNNL